MNNATPLERGVFVEHTLASPQHIAVDRLLSCQNGELDLSGLGLTILPPISEGIIELKCFQNQLTSIPRLPSTLVRLYCSSNQLTSLPELPPSLEELVCSNNQLTSLPELPPLRNLWCSENPLFSLPELPPSLRSLRCHKNRLTTLPTLPPNMTSLSCNHNPLTCLPTLPLSMELLYCHFCRLTSLPTLPTNLRELNCLINPLETLPELPSTLEMLKATLPWVEDLEENVRLGGPRIYYELWPQMVGTVNQMIRMAAALTHRQSKRRCVERCKKYKEEIMMTVWHPRRVNPLIEMGIDLEDVM